MGLEFSLESLETTRWCHFWWQTVPSCCCSEGERSVDDRREPCQTSAEVDNERRRCWPGSPATGKV